MDTKTAPSPGTVVVGYDGSEHAEEALRWAADEAVLDDRVLSVVHVVEPSSGPGTGAEADLLLRALGARLQAGTPDLAIELVLATGDPRQVLVALSSSASSLFVGSRGRGPVTTLLLGSVGVAVSRSARCPTFVIRPCGRRLVSDGVLVGTDATAASQPTLELAFRQASLRRLPLTVLHSVGSLGPELRPGIVDDESRYPGIRAALADTVAELGAAFPEVRTRLLLAHGAPDRNLITLSEQMDLVVVGHHHGPDRGDLVRLGSFAPAVVESARCPVVVVFSAVRGGSPGLTELPVPGVSAR
jgi:nucleotide-binding universal stress UspA family protein